MVFSHCVILMNEYLCLKWKQVQVERVWQILIVPNTRRNDNDVM